MFFVGYLGEIMITQVSGRISTSVFKDPRRRAQSVQFKNRNYIPYKGNNEADNKEQVKKAVFTSVAVVAGSIAFMIGYFLLSARGLKKPRVA